LSEEAKLQDEKLKGVMDGKLRILEQLKLLGDTDSTSVQALTKEVEETREQRNCLKPLQLRVEEQSELLVQLQRQSRELDETIAELFTKKDELDTRTGLEKTLLDKLQLEYHAIIQSRPKPPTTVQEQEKEVDTPDQAKASLILHAIANKDQVLHKMLTGTDLPATTAAPSSSSSSHAAPAGSLAGSAIIVGAAPVPKKPAAFQVRVPNPKRKTTEVQQAADGKEKTLPHQISIADDDDDDMAMDLLGDIYHHHVSEVVAPGAG
jgi:hypothetical protein